MLPHQGYRLTLERSIPEPVVASAFRLLVFAAGCSLALLARSLDPRCDLSYSCLQSWLPPPQGIFPFPYSVNWDRTSLVLGDRQRLPQNAVHPECAPDARHLSQ